MFENIFQIFGNFIIVNHLLNNLVQLLLFLTGFCRLVVATAEETNFKVRFTLLESR
ncbi:MAG TPA: hypothetical protein QF772_03330 [Nitrospinaceae bacterium]|nr:hypothetical protein [Nitrospinaceae bacterium]